ncbi:hypothetical protein DL767_000819 [Monosporascus sp. MG133]|nr:hypothetical protein DL767_000819 [Monosporascus sp. MG133]
MVTVPPPSQPPQPAAPADGLTGTGTAHLLPPGFALSHCEPADIPGLVDVYISAFQGGNYMYWWAPTPKMRAWNGERFADPAKTQFRVVDKATVRLVPHSRWEVLAEGMRGAGMRVKRVGTEKKKKRTGGERPDVPEDMDVELYQHQPSHTNNGPGIDKAQQQCRTTDTPSASSQVHLRGGCLSESVDQDFVYYSGTSAPRPAPPVARPTRAEFPPSYRRQIRELDVKFSVTAGGDD